MKQLLIIIPFVFLSLTSFAQDKHDKIRALKTAYITEHLDLSKDEAEKFWPIYNNFTEAKIALKKDAHKKRDDINFDNLTETQANKMLAEMISLNNRRNKIYNNLITNLQNVISAKKIVMLKKVEDDFNKKMFKEYQKRHHREQQKNMN